MRTRLHPLRVGLLHAALALALIVPAAAQEPAPTRPPAAGPAADPNPAPSQAVVLGAEEGPLVIPGDAPDLIFEFTGKVAGYVEPCG
jgi:hypothetical protein